MTAVPPPLPTTGSLVGGGPSGAVARINQWTAGLLTNWADVTAPTNPTPYQLWCDRANATSPVLKLFANSAWVPVAQMAPQGTQAAPGMAFASDRDTGLWNPAPNELALGTGGVRRMHLAAARAILDVPLVLQSGSAAAPAIGFTGSTPDTGLYLDGIQSFCFGHAGLVSATIRPGGEIMASARFALPGNVTMEEIGGADTGIVFGVGPTQIGRMATSASRFGPTPINNPGEGNNTYGAAVESDGFMHLSRGGGGCLTLNRGLDNGGTAFFARGGNTVGSISVTGSATAYNTSSDHRLKYELPWPETYDAASIVARLAGAMRHYGFWGDLQASAIGWFAHELAAIVPEAVTGEHDAVETLTDPETGGTWTRPVMQGRDDTKLVPHLVKALAEALARIEALTARIDALTARIAALEGAAR